MKKIYLLATFAFICCLFSCSNDEVEAAIDGVGSEIAGDDYIPGDSEIAINLGTVAKRAAIEGDNGDLDEMGIWLKVRMKLINQLTTSIGLATVRNGQVVLWRTSLLRKKALAYRGLMGVLIIIH